MTPTSSPESSLLKLPHSIFTLHPLSYLTHGRRNHRKPYSQLHFRPSWRCRRRHRVLVICGKPISYRVVHAQGIGLMISSTLIANGAIVYIIGPKQADLDRIAKVYNDAVLQKGGGKMIGLEGDIRSKSEALRLAEEVGKREKHVTALFNNAGILVGSFTKPTTPTADAFKKAYFDPITQEEFNDSLNTNAIGPYWLTFAFLPMLEAWKSNGELARKFVPQVIMTSSMNGWTKDPATAGSSFPYMFSKSAIGHFTASLAHELLPLGIRVNGIAPGLFPSEMSALGTSNELGQSRVIKPLPLVVPANPAGGTNRDMGSLALMLIANGFINGETVLIDGGILLAYPSSY